jgi:hypothetical protein
MPLAVKSSVIANNIAVVPSTADTINHAIVIGMDALQTAAPAVTAAGIIATATMIAHDVRKTNQVSHNMARREVFEKSTAQNKSGKIRKAVGNTAFAMLAALPTSLFMGGTAFTLGTEHSVRADQLKVLDTAFQEAGITPDDLFVTQYGVDTPMDTSFVPKSVAADLHAPGFYVQLPTVTDTDTGQKMNGLMLSMPTLPPETVVTSGLVGSKENDSINVNGERISVTEVNRNLASMQRETLLVSNDIAEQIAGYESGDGAYFGLYIPHETISKESLQQELNRLYGEDRYTAITIEEFRNGTEDFMAKNASSLLMLVALAFTAAGISVGSASNYRQATKNRKTHGTQKAIGATNYQVAAPEILAATYRLAIALPGSALIGGAMSKGANAINLGLSSAIDTNGLLAALVVIGTPTIAASAVAVRKSVRKITPAEAVRHTA